MKKMARGFLIKNSGLRKKLNQKEINKLLYKTAEQYPLWTVFADNWNVLIKLYEQEKNQSSAPKLYKKMCELRSNE